MVEMIKNNVNWCFGAHVRQSDCKITHFYSFLQTFIAFLKKNLLFPKIRRTFAVA